MAAAAGGAGDIFRGVYEGSISGSHIEIDRRPYHKNCTCPLHGLRSPKCPNHKNVKVSYPIRRSWSEGSLALYAASSSSPNLSPSSSSSPSFNVFPPKTANRHDHVNDVIME